MKIISKRSCALLIFTSLILFTLSFIFFVFVNNDQINTSPYYAGEVPAYADLTTITQKESWSGNNLRDKTELVIKKIIEDSFTAKTDNLGTIAIPLDTHGKSVNGAIVFRVKEASNKNWYYQNTYKGNQFQDNAPFPFGFPVIIDSKNKSYTFQIEAIAGKSNNSISLSKPNTFFFSKYKFSKEALIKNPQALLQFLIVKMNTRLSLFTGREISLIILFGFSPFIYYFCKYLFKKLFVLRKNSTILNSLNPRKYIFYISTISGLLLFLLYGLITRANNYYNFFFLPTQYDYFSDFYYPLSESFDGPYAHGNIYPPLPSLMYRLMLRLVPYNIASHGGSAIKESHAGQMVFLFYMLIALLLLFVLLMEAKKGSRIEKYIFIFITLFSTPFLFTFERGNIIFVALLFLIAYVFFKDSKNRFVRELALASLAVSAAIKIYPAIFGLLLIKEKRFKDLLRVVLYGAASFILPIFFLGGIGQFVILFKNIFFVPTGVSVRGVGYATNIQDMARMVGSLFGNFGNTPIHIGSILSLVILILGIISAFFLRSKWKTVTLLSLLMALVPPLSFVYVLIFMIIPLIMFLDREKEDKPSNYFYLLGFIIIFIPSTLGVVDIINKGFGIHARPLTYGVLAQNIVLVIMTGSLIWEGLRENIFKTTKNLLPAFLLKISNQLSRFEKFYWLIPVFVIFVYNLIFFNKYLPITEGWFSMYAWLVNHGHFPYRDFYFFLTPLYLIQTSIFTALFGYDILYLRILGILVILLMTYFLYKNIQIIFGSAIAAFVAIVGMIYYQSGVAHITYDFTQFVTLYGLIQSYFLLKYINAFDTKTNPSIKWVFWAGLFAGLAFLTKQSNGTMIAAFSFIGLSVLTLQKGWKEALRASLLYIGGFAVPLAITILWLLANSAFMQFREQVFSSAVAAKGGLMQIFFGWFKEVLNYNFIVRLIEIVFIMLIPGYWIYLFKGKKLKNENINRVTLLVASVILLLIMFLPLFIDKIIAKELSKFVQGGIDYIAYIMVVSFYTPIILVLIYTVFLIFRKPYNKSIFLLSLIALGFIYGAGTSAGFSEAGAIIGFCIFIALMLHLRSVFGLGKIFIVVFCLIFSFLFIEMKYERPYFWWYVTSTDIREKLQSTNKIKMLRGMYTSKDNIKLIEEVTAEIRSGSKPGEPVLTFPNIPVFYLLSDRKPPGKAIVHWFDFLPDEIAVKEAEAIKKNPPKVIVYLDLGPIVWNMHENLFRDSKPSGQRKIVEAFMGVIKSKKMHISKKYELPYDVTLTIWRN